MITHEPSYTDYTAHYAVGRKAGFKRSKPYFTLLQKQLIALLIVFTSAFLLAFEFGWIEIFFK